MIRYVVRHLGNGRTLYSGPSEEDARRIYTTNSGDPIELVREEPLERSPAAEEHAAGRARAFPWIR